MLRKSKIIKKQKTLENQTYNEFNETKQEKEFKKVESKQNFIRKKDKHLLCKKNSDDLTIVSNDNVNLYFVKKIICTVDYFNNLIYFNNKEKDIINLDLNSKTIIMLLHLIKYGTISDKRVYIYNIIELWDFSHEIMNKQSLSYCNKYIANKFSKVIKHFDIILVCKKIILYIEQDIKDPEFLYLKKTFGKHVDLILQSPNFKDIDPIVFTWLTYEWNDYLKLLHAWVNIEDNINNISKVGIYYKCIDLSIALKMKDVIIKTKDHEFLKGILLSLMGIHFQ